jgi:hypothetical protein
VIALGSNGNPVLVTGALGNTNGNGSGGKDNSDFSKVTNSAGYTTIGISLQFANSLGGGDSASLRINGPGVSEIIAVTGQGLASFTINGAQSGATYVVEIRTQFNDGQINYTLTYDPSPDMGLQGQINAKQAEIVVKQQEIAKIQSWIAANDAAIASTSAKVKKAKTKTKKRKFVKTLKTIQSWKQQNTLNLVVAQSELTILQNDLANLQSML